MVGAVSEFQFMKYITVDSDDPGIKRENSASEPSMNI